EKHEPMNLTSSMMVCSWEQPDQCQSLCSHWLGACKLPGMLEWHLKCHPSHAFSVLDDKHVFVKVHTLWEVLCTYVEILHIKLPLKPYDLKTWSSGFYNFCCFMKVLQGDESIIKPEQEFFTAPFEKSCMNDFYIQGRDMFFNPATRSYIVSLNRV
ncbi:Anoctamin-6, partial [Camelus dromedarius]